MKKKMLMIYLYSKKENIFANQTGQKRLSLLLYRRPSQTGTSCQTLVLSQRANSPRRQMA